MFKDLKFKSLIILFNLNPMVMKMIMIALLVIVVIGQSKKADLKSLLPEINNIIQKGKQNIWNEIEQDEPLWNFPPWLGTFFISEYYFELKAIFLNETDIFQSQFDHQFFTQKLLREQLPDGSWKQLLDENRKQGLLDATIFNYWYLKDVGVEQNSIPMKKARKFILAHGGIEGAQIMTRYKLAAFGQYQWQLLHYVPLFIFRKDSLFSYTYIKDYVAQWVYPHITGLAYLRYHKTIFPVSKVCLSELMTSRSYPPCETMKKNQIMDRFSRFNVNTTIGIQRDFYVDNLMEEMISLKGNKGLMGAYSISTLLSLMSFKDYTLRYNKTQNQFHAFFKKNVNTSLQFIEQLYFNKRVPYMGSLDDGRYWDTILAAYALLEAGENPEKISPTIQYLVKHAVQKNGGIPYGLEFQYAPDIDDTAMLLMLYGKMKNYFKEGTQKHNFYLKEIQRTYNWLQSTQNSDGGFPAFDKDKNDGQYPLIKLIFRLTSIDKSAQIFDPSCPDIVGHLLQGMAEADVYDSQKIKKMMDYLWNSRKDGMWSGRWGINYVYAVGAVFPGLAKIGYNMNQSWIINVTKRMMEVQQQDGGFGQDHESYNQDKYVEGVTTASMTAWGLLGYLEVGDYLKLEQNIFNATKYLIRNFRQNGDKFYDRSVIGTGHRGVLNLQYPVYAYSFPLVSLARLRDYIEGKRINQVNSSLNKEISNHFKQFTDEL